MSTPGPDELRAMLEGPVYQRLDLTSPGPYTRGEYARRALWVVVERTVFRFSPARAKRFRVWLVNVFGGRVARTVNLRPSVRIRHPWLLRMGEFSCLADDVNCYNLGPITIGEHTVVSQGTHLCAGTHDYRQLNLPLVRPAIEIGSGVWVCADCFIGPGVRIGDNAVVGAASVVSRDVPPGVIAAGNPAVVLRDRPRPRGMADPSRKAPVIGLDGA